MDDPLYRGAASVDLWPHRLDDDTAGSVGRRRAFSSIGQRPIGGRFLLHCDRVLCHPYPLFRSTRADSPSNSWSAGRPPSLKYIEPERLILTSDCGFGRQSMSRMHAFYKMVALTRGTNIVRKELGLPEATIPATDPKLSMVPLTT